MKDISTENTRRTFSLTPKAVKKLKALTAQMSMTQDDIVCAVFESLNFEDLTPKQIATAGKYKRANDKRRADRLKLRRAKSALSDEDVAALLKSKK